ncbi:MAG: hypothetical protein J07HQX50_00698 [Haloquadratum sp. J07HQX50]|nr:MAG: hypothetical protein J07HQX50_00698 [Haloquadratum sp. J07HQX50]
MAGDIRSYLRMCGYDTVYVNDDSIEDLPGALSTDPPDSEIVSAVEATGRRLVTRDYQLAQQCSNTITLTTTETSARLSTLQEAGVCFKIESSPTYCGVCNGSLERAAVGNAPAYVADSIDRCWSCNRCEQYFWKGSHWEQVKQTLHHID